MSIEALDPCSDPAPVALVPLAARLSELAGRRVTLVQTMPPGSGLEAVIAALDGSLTARGAATRTFVRRNFMVTDEAEIDEVVAGSDAAIVVAGPAATMVHLALIFATGLERRGVPTSLVYFDALASSAAHSLTTVGAPVRSFPAGPPPHAVAAAAVDALIAPLADAERVEGVRRPPRRERIAAHGSLDDVLDAFHAAGWTDGLPIVPPTDERVAAMLAGTSRRPGDVVTETFRPEGRVATVEMVAINAVMAGAKPDHLPLILAAASVLGDLPFESMTRSVNSFAFAQLVSGPGAAAIGMTGGLGALGPGNRANAAIGRTIGLLQRTVGGARPGVNVTPTQGNNAAYTSAFCEHTDNPWEPFHVGEGFDAADTTVSILLGGWAHNGSFYYGDLDDVARALQSFDGPQTGAFVFVSSKRAHQLATDGWTKQSIADHLHAAATIRLGDFRASGFWPMCRSQIERRGPSTAPVWGPEYLTLPDDAIVPGYPPGTIKVVVVGSDVSSLVQAWKWQLHRTVSMAPWA